MLINDHSEILSLAMALRAQTALTFVRHLEVGSAHQISDAIESRAKCWNDAASLAIALRGGRCPLQVVGARDGFLFVVCQQLSPILVLAFSNPCCALHPCPSSDAYRSRQSSSRCMLVLFTNYKDTNDGKTRDGARSRDAIYYVYLPPPSSLMGK